MTLDAINSALAAARFFGTAMVVIQGILSLSDPRVVIDQGPLRGTTLKSRAGKDIFTFQGIPYAAAPVGNLRFRNPQAPPAWNEERLVNVEADKCLQRHVIFEITEGSEDCLYLNVYTPQLERKGVGLSVMVWIHGGGFTAGSGDSDLYGPQHLLDHDVVLVTFNYRLGAFGFLSLGSKEAPGNYGLKDQVSALRWVQRNIDKFGGNPNSVTIFGQSAGGASVHYLMSSPQAQGLFHRAIAQSGSALNSWALDPEAGRLGLGAAAALKCRQKSIPEVLVCLRKIDASMFLDVAKMLKTRYKKDFAFVPTIEPADTEDPFLNEEPRELLTRGDISNVPFMAGLTSHEGMLQLGKIMFGRSATEDYYANQGKFLEFAGVRRGTKEAAIAWFNIEQFYQNLTRGDFMEQYILMYSDIEGVLGVDEMVRGVSALRRSPVFYYQFSYDGGLNLFKSVLNIKRPGASHADELGYLFSTMFPMWMFVSPEDQLTITRITKLWTDFAKTGNPTSNRSLGVEWRTTDAEITRYLDIGTNLRMKEVSLNGERVAFWRRMQEYYQSLPESARAKRLQTNIAIKRTKP